MNKNILMAILLTGLTSCASSNVFRESVSVDPLLKEGEGLYTEILCNKESFCSSFRAELFNSLKKEGVKVFKKDSIYEVLQASLVGENKKYPSSVKHRLYLNVTSTPLRETRKGDELVSQEYRVSMELVNNSSNQVIHAKNITKTFGYSYSPNSQFEVKSRELEDDSSLKLASLVRESLLRKNDELLIELKPMANVNADEIFGLVQKGNATEAEKILSLASSQYSDDSYKFNLAFVNYKLNKIKQGKELAKDIVSEDDKKMLLMLFNRGTK